MSIIGNSITNQISRLPDYRVYGHVTQIIGLLIEIGGVEGSFMIGDHCVITGRGGREVLCEAVGFRDGKALAMPFGSLDGIGLGCKVEISASSPAIYPDESWIGRVINAFGEPIDGKGPLGNGPKSYSIHSKPPPAHSRSRIGGKLDVGVRALNTFLTVCEGQRLGIFAGSGVGKSILMSMMARHTSAEASVIGLIGERGREAREFIEDDLGEEGLARSIVVVATSDEAPLVRRQAAYLTLTVAEFLRDQGKNVLCLMDSVTRFAMAQREIGLSAGEPPATKGYTPSVFSELPKLLERAGPGIDGHGSITGLFTVLVEGDDHNEPIADAVRGILDGHVVMERSIAERGRFPAINVTKSISRSMPKCNTDEENELVIRARRLMATYEDMEELIRLGAYRRGSDKTIDESIHYYPMIEDFLRQKIEERTGLQEGYNMLSEVLGVPVIDEEQILDEEPADQQIQTGDEQQTEPITEQ